MADCKAHLDDLPLEIGQAWPCELQAASIPKIEGKPSVDDVLEAILPPRRWVSGGKTFEQHISTEPSTRQDVITLDS